MEIVFQNKLEDFEAFYDYILKSTEEGKKLITQAYRSRQTWIIEHSVLWGALAWGVTGSWKIGLGGFVFFLILLELLFLLISGFKPRYYVGKQILRNQEKQLNPTAIQAFQLPRTLKTDDDWLEVSSSESVQRWRWRQIVQIGLTLNFVFIHVGNSPIIYVPKRDFSSEQNFLEFGNQLKQLVEKHKDEAVGTE